MNSRVKHILIPTDGSESAMVGARYAIAVARHCKATIHGLFVVDIKLLEGPFLRDISASLGTAPYANYQGNIAMILEERGKGALESISEACEEAGVACETHETTGLVVRSILEASELADLIIMGRTGEHHEWLEGIVGSTTEAVVRRATQPVLVTGREQPGNERFLVAYDGSAHARRALQVGSTVSGDWAAPLHVLVVAENEGPALLEEAKSYLEPHDLPIEYVTRQGDPSEQVVEYAEECQADLLIMGAYGHTKVREFVVGSTTTYAMNHAPCPLLLTR